MANVLAGNIISIEKMERRPCWVNGRKGMFHKWIEKEIGVILPDGGGIIPGNHLLRAKEAYENDGIILSGFKLDKVKNTYALIEFEDGHIEEIPPTTITFLDHSDFEGYLWGDEKDCINCKFDLLPSNAARPCYDCKLGGGEHNCFTRK